MNETCLCVTMNMIRNISTNLNTKNTYSKYCDILLESKQLQYYCDVYQYSVESLWFDQVIISSMQTIEVNSTMDYE